jgi:chromatin remodeling complex protein RSC6
MTKTTKTTTTEPPAAKSVQPASTPVPVQTASSETPAKAKKVLAPKAAKESAVQDPPVSEVPVVQNLEDVVADTVDSALMEQSSSFFAKMSQVSLLIATLKTEYRALEKKWTRELKASHKLNSKRKRKVGNRAPSGFVKPTRISDELANFLGREVGCEMARTDVTREINGYIRANKLQDVNNGRTIIPDNKLASLLKIGDGVQLTYFNLQTYMKPHFASSSNTLA